MMGKKWGIVAVLGMLIFSINGMASEPLVAEINAYQIKVGGELKALAKSQKAYDTALDRPDWGWKWRSGANKRDEQYFRFKGSFWAYFGDPGKTAWFGVAEVKFDANDPDDPDSFVKENHDTWDNYEDKLEVGNAFIMWRPYIIQGGRPFGIALGQQTIKATANAAYTHIFQGDFEDDFFMYTASGLLDVPAISLDFHVDANTGVGITFARGCGDVSEAGGGTHTDAVDNWIYWFEALKWNVGISGALQQVKGNTRKNLMRLVPTGYELTEHKKDYTHYLANGTLSYTLKLNQAMQIKPFLGYQKIWGDQIANVQAESLGYLNREIDAEIVTGGFSFDHRLMGKEANLAFEYSDVSVPDIDGIGGLEPGLVSGYATVADLLNGGRFTAQLPNHTWDPKNNVSGFNDAVFVATGIDAAMHVEYALKMDEKITIGIFYNRLEAAKIKTRDTAYERQQVIDGLTRKFMLESDADYETANRVATDLTDNGLDAINSINPDHAQKTMLGEITTTQNYAEWEDDYAYGLFVKYAF